MSQTMDNSYLIYTSKDQEVCIERFHMCTWEFNNNGNLIEFGCELVSNSIINKNRIEIEVFVPWLTANAIITDFYTRLCDTSNSRFVFNDSVSSVFSLDGGENLNGVIHQFSGKGRLCILPVEFKCDFDSHKIILIIDLVLYNQYDHSSFGKHPNVYFRFCIDPKIPIQTIKKGITKSTILYDVRVNQRRNIPDFLLNEILQKQFCLINKCFSFNIVPNTHDIVFLDDATLKNVRKLEFGSFKRYLGKDLLKEENLIVVFNKEESLDSYSFFSIYTKEHIGVDQLAVALLINLLAGILLFIASLNVSLFLEQKAFAFTMLPASFWGVIVLFLLMLAYFLNRRFHRTFKIKVKNRK